MVSGFRSLRVPVKWLLPFCPAKRFQLLQAFHSGWTVMRSYPQIGAQHLIFLPSVVIAVQASHLSAPKLCERRFYRSPAKSRFLRPQDARFPCDQKPQATGDVPLLLKRAKLIPIAGISAIPEFAVKIASNWQCADFGALIFTPKPFP